MSKRKLLLLVNEGHVTGWDDPRMPTLSGMRRRGYPPEAIRQFCEMIGVAKRENLIDISVLEFCVREHLNKTAHRVMMVFDPVKLIITNYPESATEELETENNPEDPEAGHRKLPFSRELWIEREDFMENPPKKFFRLGIGLMVRLKSAYIIQCHEVKKDEAGNITEIHCTYFPESRSGHDTSGIHVKGTIHWVEAHTAFKTEVNMYDRLFQVDNPASEEGDFKSYLNPDSLHIQQVFMEPTLADARPGQTFQAIRKGYFTVDVTSEKDHLIFNRTVGLKDTWTKSTK